MSVMTKNWDFQAMLGMVSSSVKLHVCNICILYIIHKCSHKHANLHVPLKFKSI